MEKMYSFEFANINMLKKAENSIRIAKLTQEIEELQKQFAETDYKTTKNLQYEKMGLNLPYAWDEIYNTAEAIRKAIREKETEINNLLQLTSASSENK